MLRRLTIGVAAEEFCRLPPWGAPTQRHWPLGSVTSFVGLHVRIEALDAASMCQRHVILAGVWPGEIVGSHRIDESFAHHANFCALGPVPAESQL